MDEDIFFIGIDLSDPLAKQKRSCTRAILTSKLTLSFDEWPYDLSGSKIVPEEISKSPHVLAIDGPQGLASDPRQGMRLSERLLHTAGKSPYELPSSGRPYSGFVYGSVKLFYSLSTSHNFNLYGLKGLERDKANLIEVYPGSAWPIFSGRKLKNKRLLEGRRERYQILLERGLRFEPRYEPPSHDQLDAALAAYIAYLFKCGKTQDFGEEAFEDASFAVLREGFIVQPLKTK